jgi:hypothetical protein
VNAPNDRRVGREQDPARPVRPEEVTAPSVGAPSDNTTLVDVLAALRRSGYENSLTADEDGELSCSNCGRRTPPEQFEVDHERRLEGASDPADEMLVLAGTCQACGERAVIVLGFGPTASPADEAALGRLSLGPA